MTTIRIYGKAEADLAMEFAGLMDGRSAVRGNHLEFDPDDAAYLEGMARSAETYWRSRKGNAGAARMMKAAEALMRRFGEVRASEEYARSLELRRIR